MSKLTFSILLSTAGLTLMLVLPGAAGRRWRFVELALWKRALAVALLVATCFFGRGWNRTALIHDPGWSWAYPIGIWLFFVVAFALRDRRVEARARSRAARD